MTLRDLRERRGEVLASMRALVKNAEARGDSKLSTADQSKYDQLLAQSNDLRDEITAGEAEQDRQRAAAAAEIEGRLGASSGSGYAFKDMASGELIRAHSGKQPLATEKLDSDLGDVLRAICLNDLSSLPKNTADTIGSDTGGGYLANPTLSTMIVDLARANSVAMQAGAQTVPMKSSELRLARITGDPTLTWRQETGAVTLSKSTFGMYTLRPKTLSAMVPASLELLEDAPNAGQIISDALTKAMAVELDRAILEGSGAGAEPIGIVNTSGVNSQTSVGTPTDYSDMTTAVKNVLNSNFNGNISDLAWTMNPVIGATYDGLVTGISGDSTPLRPTPWVSQLQRFYTTSHAVSGSDYNMIAGYFPEVLVGMRTNGVVLDLLDEATGTDEDGDSWNAATQFMRFIRARMRVDVIVMRPSFFSVLSGVNA
jgi:HK97 family phage major capsid protein